MNEDSFIIIMPAYNEEDCISEVVDSWMKLVDQYPWSEMLVINDGSTDKTAEKLDKLNNKHKNLKVIHKNNEGHGPTVRRGYEEAVKTNHNWVFQTDSDDQFLPIDFPKLWGVRQHSNFILGCRIKRQDALHRLVITKMIKWFNAAAFGKLITDVNVPYRLIRREYLSGLLSVLPEGLFAPNIFLSILAAHDNQNLMDVAITHKERETGKVSIVKWKLIKVCLRGLKELFVFRLKLPSKIKKLRELGDLRMSAQREMARENSQGKQEGAG